MFNNSNIDNSDLVSSKPVINYDDVQLKNEGYKLKYALNPENPVYTQVITECKNQKLLFKTIKSEHNQEHIWIKENN